MKPVKPVPTLLKSTDLVELFKEKMPKCTCHDAGEEGGCPDSNGFG